MDLTFKRVFKNSVNMEIAGVWFDDERGEWRVSTEPIRGFPTEQDAVDFFNIYCDHETGVPGRGPTRDSELVHKLMLDVQRGTSLREQTGILTEQMTSSVKRQRDALRLIQDNMRTKPE